MQCAMAERKTLLLGDVQRSDVKEILDLIVEKYTYNLMSTQ